MKRDILQKERNYSVMWKKCKVNKGTDIKII